MTHTEFSHLLQRIDALSPEQIQQLRRELDSKVASSAVADQPPLTAEQSADLELQHRLFEAGLLSEIKPPVTDLTPYRNRKSVPIQGEPLSETVIRERR